jgi:hypothetical protein
MSLPETQARIARPSHVTEKRKNTSIIDAFFRPQRMEILFEQRAAYRRSPITRGGNFLLSSSLVMYVHKESFALPITWFGYRWVITGPKYVKHVLSWNNHTSSPGTCSRDLPEFFQGNRKHMLPSIFSHIQFTRSQLRLDIDVNAVLPDLKWSIRFQHMVSIFLAAVFSWSSSIS